MPRVSFSSAFSFLLANWQRIVELMAIQEALRGPGNGKQKAAAVIDVLLPELAQVYDHQNDPYFKAFVGRFITYLHSESVLAHGSSSGAVSESVGEPI